MKHIILASLITASLGTTGALAQMAPASPGEGPMGGDREGPEAMFERTDTNGDGVITQEEAKAQRTMLFDKLDRNDDGFLDNAEKRLGKHKRHARRKMHRTERKADRQLALDTDKDGKISLAEFEARQSPTFTRLDSNNDGAISAEEHKAAKAKQFARMDNNKDGFLSPDDKKQRHEKHRAKAKKHSRAFDINRDGRVSRIEFVDTQTPMFTHFDLDKNGQVTREEMQNAPRPAMHGKGRRK